MIDMKLTPEQKRKEYECSPSALDVPSYPYNLKIRLNPEQVAALGIADLDVGKKLKLSAMVEITEKEKCQVVEGQPDISCCVQICEMEFDKEKKAAAQVFYDEKK